MRICWYTALVFQIPPATWAHLAAWLPYIRLRLCRYDTRSDVKFEKDAPIIGLVLQRSHLVTGDEGHYAGVVSNLESRGAKVHLLLHQSTCCDAHT